MPPVTHCCLINVWANPFRKMYFQKQRLFSLEAFACCSSRLCLTNLLCFPLPGLPECLGLSLCGGDICFFFSWFWFLSQQYYFIINFKRKLHQIPFSFEWASLIINNEKGLFLWMKYNLHFLESKFASGIYLSGSHLELSKFNMETHMCRALNTGSASKPFILYLYWKGGNVVLFGFF